MDVRKVQAELHRIGLAACCGPIDGENGPRTTHAIWWFAFAYCVGGADLRHAPLNEVLVALERCARNGGRASDHFAFREFASKGNGEAHVKRELLLGLERYRELAGPTRIVSGYRDPAHNRKVDGATSSQHLHGHAADVVPRLSLRQVASLEVFSGIGVVRASGLVAHVDVRHVAHNTTGGTTGDPTVWYYPR